MNGLNNSWYKSKKIWLKPKDSCYSTHLKKTTINYNTLKIIKNEIELEIQEWFDNPTGNPSSLIKMEGFWV